MIKIQIHIQIQIQRQKIQTRMTDVKTKRGSNKAISVQYTLVNKFSEVPTYDRNTNTNTNTNTKTKNTNMYDGCENKKGL